jgi:hypothetical protein
MKGKEITPGELAYYYIKHGIENDLGKIFMLHGDLEKLINAFNKG